VSCRCTKEKRYTFLPFPVAVVFLGHYDFYYVILRGQLVQTAFFSFKSIMLDFLLKIRMKLPTSAKKIIKSSTNTKNLTSQPAAPSRASREIKPLTASREEKWQVAPAVIFDPQKCTEKDF
jgi:hypothetical protein